MTETIHAPGWDPLKPDPVALKKFSTAQLNDFQGDLLKFVPELAPVFKNGVDAITGIKEVDDRGQTAHGIAQGWVWSVYLPYYVPAQREMYYQKCLLDGDTHVCIQVCQQTEASYHGIRPNTADDIANWGAKCMIIHQELLDHGLIPVCAGVAPGPAQSGGAALADGFDGHVALVAMSDWDNTPWAEQRIKLLHNTFPNAQIWYELPGGAIQPELQPGDEFSITTGGEWLRQIQQKYTRFVGVMHETSTFEGGDPVVAELTAKHPFWRDVPEMLFETDTYKKFWEGGDEAQFKRVNDDLRRRLSYMSGFMCGATTHPRIADAPPSVVGDAVGDMIPVDQITFVGGPDIKSFAKTAEITKLELRLDGVYVEFTKQDGPDAWPDTVPVPKMGLLQYSMGICLKINGQWYGSAPIELWRGLKLSGGPIQSQAVQVNGIKGQINGNWFYDGTWAPMNTHQPSPGEEIGFFVCSGDARNGHTTVNERSNIVMFKLPDDGQAVSMTWTTL